MFNRWIKTFAAMSAALWICSAASMAFAQAPAPNMKPDIVRPGAPQPKPVPPQIDIKDHKKIDLKPVNPILDAHPPKISPPKDPKDPRIPTPAPKVAPAKPAPDPVKPDPTHAPENIKPLERVTPKIPKGPAKFYKPRNLTPMQKECMVDRNACKQDCKAEQKICGHSKNCANRNTICREECSKKFPCR